MFWIVVRNFTEMNHDAAEILQFFVFFLLERKNSVDDRAQYDIDFVKVRDN